MAGESAETVARRQREKAGRLLRSADLWQHGAEGERATATVLDSLPGNYWTVFHDVAWPGRPRANIDHVAVGPPGVFVIDSKNWSGAVSLRDGVLRQSGRSRASSIAGLEAATQAVAATLLPTGAAVTRGILCLTGSGQASGTAGTTAVLSVAELSQYLLSLPPVIHEASLTGLADQVRARLEPAEARTPVAPFTRSGHGYAPAAQTDKQTQLRPDRSGRAPVGRHPRGKGRRSSGGLPVGDLVKGGIGAVIVLAAVTQPHLISSVGRGISAAITSGLTPDDATVPAGGPTDAPGADEQTKKQRKRQEQEQPETGK